MTTDEILICLVEECAEVVKASTKCIRFGYDRTHEGYGHNATVLAEEIGDLLGLIAALPLDQATIERCRLTKLERCERAKRLYGK